MVTEQETFHDRRENIRKEADENIPIEVSVNDIRKKLDHDIKATVMYEVIGICSLKDVSKSGFRIKGQGKMQKGQLVGLHFLIPWGGKNLPIFPVCKVVWQKKSPEGEGIFETGLKIDQIHDAQKEPFETFVEKLPEID